MAVPITRASTRPHRGRSGSAAVLLALVLTLLLSASAQAAQTVEVTVGQLTGTSPFEATAAPGNDTGAANDIIRSNDELTYQVQFNVNDDSGGSSTAENVTVTQTLPLGMTWVRLPAICLTSGVTPVSSIVGQTLTCNVGDLATGTARTLSLTARVNETTNGAVLTPAAGSVTATADGAASDSVTPAPVTVSSVPRVDMVKNSAPTVTVVASGGTGGVPGYNIAYPVSVRIPDVGGRGLIGYSPPDPAMTLVDDFSDVSPNAELVGCATGSRGVWSCAPGGDPQMADVSITVTDATTHSGGVLSSSTLTVFVPKSDLDGAGTLNTTNRFVDLDATGSGGTVPAVGEITSNNAYSFALSNSAAGSFLKHYVDVTNGSGRYIPGGPNVDRNGAAVVNTGQIFQAEVRLGSTNAVAGFNSIAACDVFDTTTQQATTEGAAATANGGAPAWVTANSVTGGTPLVRGVDFVIEYSTVPTSTDPDQLTRWAALRATDCGGSPADWSTTPPADAADITKVRARLLTTPPNQFTLAFAVNLKALPGDNGNIIANFMPVQTNADPDAGPWSDPSYTPQNHGGTRGDRVILSAATTRLAKDIINPAVGPTTTPSVTGGSQVQFRLRPEVVEPIQGGTGPVTARDLTVTDILPAGTTLSDEVGREPSPAPTSTVVNGDGTTTVTWELGDIQSGTTPAITYWARVSTTAAGNKVNRAIVTSPDDAGSMNPNAIPATSNNPRFAARTINVDVLAGIQIDKFVRDDVIEPGDDMTFDVTYANLFQTPVNDLQTIDVLPFNGDGAAQGPVPGRVDPSDFHGEFTLEDVDVNDGETVEYTDADPAAVYASTNQTAGGQAGYGVLPAGESWCTEVQIAAAGAGCPTSVGEATAIRITRPGALAGFESRTFSYTLRTQGNRSGDVYANTAALRSPSITLGTLSPTRNVRVVANRIGDYVWEDLDKNGRQDAGEPGVPNVRVTLQGTNKRGEPVELETTTDADGRYLFTASNQVDQGLGGFLNLVSGTYRVIFDPESLPERASFTTRAASGVPDDESSHADPATGATEEITLPDPTPTRSDGENLTLDAGIVVAPAPPPTEEPPPSSPPAPPVVTTPPPAEPSPPPAAQSPRLTVSKTVERGKVRAGRTVRFTIRVRNRSDVAARNVRVCDRLPAGLAIVSSTRGVKIWRGDHCWTVRQLAPRSQMDFRVTVRALLGAKGRKVNRAYATAAGVRTTARASRPVRVLPHQAAGGGVTG
jgi:uncharacterized repeat protein (TIGR01451 family)